MKTWLYLLFRLFWLLFCTWAAFYLLSAEFVKYFGPSGWFSLQFWIYFHFVEKTDHRKPKVFFFFKWKCNYLSLSNFVTCSSTVIKVSLSRIVARYRWISLALVNQGDFPYFGEKLMQLRSHKRNKKEVSLYICPVSVLPAYSCIRIHLPAKSFNSHLFYSIPTIPVLLPWN